MHTTKPLLAAMLLPAIAAGCSDTSLLPPADKPLTGLNLDSLAVVVAPDAPREYSFTDKKSAFWYGMTHSNDWDDWYAGWNIAKRRLLSDYTLYADTARLDRATADATVYPYMVERTYAGGAREQFYMFDNVEALLIRLDVAVGDTIAIGLSPRLLTAGSPVEGGVEFTPREAPDSRITVMPLDGGVAATWTGDRLAAPAAAGGFILAYTRPGEDAAALAATIRAEGEAMLAQRRDRMARLAFVSAPTSSNLPDLDKALAWITLTTDQLVTRQQGNGIYAGLPWFNEYWGRDMFIAMPGAVLCTGQWQPARDILLDFAQFQDTTAGSPTLGRIPNRANLEGIIYNTADGTPRFVIDILEYLNYTGDTAMLASVYPAVKLSVDAALAHGTDARGYLLHADADTWMDAKRQGRYPCSPRGNRANDIQALWHGQLASAATLARIMGQGDDARRWAAAADTVAAHFAADFVGPDGTIYDHLNADGTPDRQLRPNLLYALDLLAPRSDAQGEQCPLPAANAIQLADSATRMVWQRLVYPWGVASLDQEDPQFHPYHENWHHYHKDDAYHNGTVWLWNNGMAMQRMIEAGQPDIAWQLFANMNRQALAEGAVGSLSENADAWPREGAEWARRSGTFLQAWSNAEQLRVWRQGFLGIRPHMLESRIDVAPMLPTAITELRYSQPIAQGRLDGAFRRQGDACRYEYRLVGLSATLALSVGPYATCTIDLADGQTAIATTDGTRLDITVVDASGHEVPGAGGGACIVRAKQERQRQADDFFRDTHFAVPSMATGLPSLSRYFDPPLDYSSVE